MHLRCKHALYDCKGVASSRTSQCAMREVSRRKLSGQIACIETRAAHSQTSTDCASVHRDYCTLVMPAPAALLARIRIVWDVLCTQLYSARSKGRAADTDSAVAYNAFLLHQKYLHAAMRRQCTAPFHSAVY